ncbi:MAG: methyltransferase domain-containing protein [Bacteroidetes bacterium]|nr:methyltransferase domain-containing protein [Bacteroidota bacterium]
MKTYINTKLQQVITDRFICPVCKQKAYINNSVVKCSNIECGINFPIVKKIPILINEDDSIFSIKDYINKPDNIVISKINIKNIAKRIISFSPSLSNNLSSKNNFILLNNLLSTKIKPKVLIIGGASITTNTDMIINPNNIVVESDVSIGPRTQIIIDGHHIPFENDTFDLLIFQAVLEHVADPYKCVQEAHRVLNNDGLIFAATPFMQQVHMRAYDFTRFTHLGHRRLFRAFNEIESGVFAGTGVALGWSIRAFVNSLIRNKYFRFILSTIVSFLFFWLKYIDYITHNNKGTFNGASGFYFIGRKSDKVLSDKELIKLFKGY